MALFKKIKNIFKKEKKKLKPNSPDVDPMDAFMEEWINETNLKKKNLITKFDLGDKRKLTEIKKTFKIDKFNKILNSDEGISIFKAIETITKIELDILDEFTKMGLAKFFKKISNQLEYEPIIRFDYNDYESYSENSEYGLLKCILNKKGDFQDYLIFYSAWVGDHMNLGTLDGTMSPLYSFKLNEKIDSKKLLKIMDTQLKRNSKSKFTVSKVYLFKKLNWSKEKLKKYINKKDFLVFIEKY
tara:strand:- start:793 stop:1521 length:729 start_codon:yes stop_codon:yes gene_type:complete